MAAVASPLSPDVVPATVDAIARALITGSLAIRSSLTDNPPMAYLRIRSGSSRSATVSLALMPLLVGCGATAPPAEKPPTTLLAGDRTMSDQVRASRDRPVPWEKTKGPLGNDRLALDELAHRRRVEHERHHQQHNLERFAHPACAGLSNHQKRTCPLTEPRWRDAGDVPGGIALTTDDDDRVQVLRMRLLCHGAYGRSQGGGSCPLHRADVRTRLKPHDKGLWLTITTVNADAVDALRSTVRALVD